MTDSENDEEVAIRLAWVDLDDEDVRTVNQFASQFHEGLFFVTVGSLVPPLFFGTDEEKRQQARELPFAPIRTVARFAVTEEKLEELIAVLQMNLERFRKATEEGR